MVFLFEQTIHHLSKSSKPTKGQYLFTIRSKRDRKRLSNFLKRVQFSTAEIKIVLTCFPKMIDYSKYNSYDVDETLREEVTSLVRLLTRDKYFIVAEVWTSS